MVCCLLRDPVGVEARPGVLESIARACSPRVAPHGDDAVIFDVDGLSRVCGPPDVIAREVESLAAPHGVTVRVAVADTLTSAWVLAHVHPGRTVVRAGGARAALGTVPVGWLGTVLDLDRIVRLADAGRRESGRSIGGPPAVEPRRGRHARGHYRVAPSPSEVGGVTGSPAKAPRTQTPADRQLVAQCRDRLATLTRWGIRTCGDLAALTRADLHARMGPMGVRLHQAACGEDVAPLVPVDEATVFADRMTLEWPIEGLEPLSFVLARQCDRLSVALERADRGAVAIHTTLTLVTREAHARSLTLPAPLRDARVLRTLILLDLESHPPPAGIDAIDLRLDVTPGRILQGSLLSLSVPTPEDLSTLLARLGALMGETRIGAPVCLDTHDPRQVAMVSFRIPKQIRSCPREGPGPGGADAASPQRATLRRFRVPLTARVVVEHGAPVSVRTGARDLSGGRVVTSAGPWRTSGGWWTDGRAAWDRDEWDVELVDGVVYRLARGRTTGTWELEGIFD